MKLKYDLAIFDLDGTILDTLGDLTACVNHALASEALPQRSRDEVCEFIGNGIRRLIERSVPENTPPDVTERVFAEFKPYYAQHCTELTVPYDGIPELLEVLRKAGCKTAVVTNKADFAAQKLCRIHFPHSFDSVLGEREGIPRKPAPDSVNETLKRLDCTAERAVYIGDSDVDIKTAQNAGMDCISVSWGFRSREFLQSSGASVIVDSPDRLPALIIDGD